jgi:hypothetical protein
MPKKTDETTKKKSDSATKSKDIVKKVEEKVKDIDAILEEKLSSALGKYEEKLEEKDKLILELQDKLTSMENKESDDEFVDISESTRIKIKSNTKGKLVFREDRGKVRVFVKFDKYGTTQNITYEELEILNSSSKHLENGRISIVKVMSNKVTTRDVIESLGLEDAYFGEESISPSEIEYLFSDEVSVAEFRSYYTNSKSLKKTIVEVAGILYKANKFKDNNKMNVLREVLRKPDLFR